MTTLLHFKKSFARRDPVTIPISQRG